MTSEELGYKASDLMKRYTQRIVKPLREIKRDVLSTSCVPNTMLGSSHTLVQLNLQNSSTEETEVWRQKECTLGKIR